MASTARDGILKYEWPPQVFTWQFSLIARGLSLGIDQNELLFAIKISWKKSLSKTKT